MMPLTSKNLWKTILRMSWSVRSINSMVADTQKGEDTMMIAIRHAASTSQLLEAVHQNLPYLTHKHMHRALETLFNIQKSRGLESDSEELIQDPRFHLLCNNIKRQARQIEPSEAINAIKVLNFLKVPPNSLIMQSMLQIIRCEINSLNFRQIIFLDFLLHKFDTKNYLVDTLKYALPLIAQIRLPLELDNEDLPMLKEMFEYSCSRGLPDRCIDYVITGLLLNHQKFDVKTAKTVLCNLCDIKCEEEHYPMRTELYNKCCHIIVQQINQLSANDLVYIASRIKKRIVEQHTEFYQPQLMDAIADYIITNEVDFERALLVAGIFSRIAHTHLLLVDYICQKATSDPLVIANANSRTLLSFINCLSNNDYKPNEQQWDEIQKQLSSNPTFNVLSETIPWIKLCLELATLGYYDDRLLQKVFSEEFLNEYLAENDNILDYFQLLSLHHAVQAFHNAKYALPDNILEKAKKAHPTRLFTDKLEISVINGLGSPAYVAKHVLLPSGFIVDLLLCFKDGYPVELPTLSGQSTVLFEQLNMPPDSLPVCIMTFNKSCYSRNSNRLRGTFRIIIDILEANGYITIPININKWIDLDNHVQTRILLREIGYRCAGTGTQLSTT